MTALQILLTPVTMGLALGYLVFSRLDLTWRGVAWPSRGCWSGGRSAATRTSDATRWTSSCCRCTRSIVIFVALPIKTYAIATMNKQGWLTRSADSIGGEGQSARTLVAEHTTTPEMAQ